MDLNEFKKVCWKTFKKYSFIKKGNNFHYVYNEEFGLVYGIQKSYYGSYCYIEPAIYIKSINEFMPFPPFSGCEIRCARLTHTVGNNLTTTFYYEILDEQEINDALEKSIPIYIDLIKGGKSEIRKCYLENEMYLSLWRGAADYLEI
ncbi:MAG: DUF4304 domain-containing protein [Ruminococcaceae bacterium]|nr:DUF4304 domain-containing protein [Oscillospiraceae bacterium]